MNVTNLRRMLAQRMASSSVWYNNRRACFSRPCSIRSYPRPSSWRRRGRHWPRRQAIARLRGPTARATVSTARRRTDERPDRRIGGVGQNRDRQLRFRADDVGDQCVRVVRAFDQYEFRTHAFQQLPQMPSGRRGKMADAENMWQGTLPTPLTIQAFSLFSLIGL